MIMRCNPVKLKINNVKKIQSEAKIMINEQRNEKFKVGFQSQFLYVYIFLITGEKVGIKTLTLEVSHTTIKNVPYIKWKNTLLQGRTQDIKEVSISIDVCICVS